MKNHGAGWVIYEQSLHKGTKELVSLLSPRRPSQSVIEFMRQIFADRWFSIDDRLSYKKSANSFPTRIWMGSHPNPIIIGHDPSLVGVYAHKISTDGDRFDFTYRKLKNSEDPLNPVFDEIMQSLRLIP